MRCLCLILVLGMLGLIGCDVENEKEFRDVDTPELENAHVLTRKVITGAEPQGAEAFRQLREWGVRTVITVDGAKPDIETAHAFGLHYVHLPLGYDGVKQERAELIAKAILEAEGPVYVHCHHGKHRGPAAAASACVVLGELTNSEAVRALETMGTGKEYQGLWQAARETKPASRSALKKREYKFAEIEALPPLADAMVHADGLVTNLELCRDAGWKTPEDHKDLDPPHEALKVRELFFELMRVDANQSRPADFKRMAKSTEDLARSLEDKLREKDLPDDKRRESATALLSQLKQSCTDCHAIYRNKSR